MFRVLFHVFFHACVYISTLRTHRKQTDRPTNKVIAITLLCKIKNSHHNHTLSHSKPHTPAGSTKGVTPTVTSPAMSAENDTSAWLAEDATSAQKYYFDGDTRDNTPAATSPARSAGDDTPTVTSPARLPGTTHRR